jgi:hypothetical protein
VINETAAQAGVKTGEGTAQLQAALMVFPSGRTYGRLICTSLSYHTLRCPAVALHFKQVASPSAFT